MERDDNQRQPTSGAPDGRADAARAWRSISVRLADLIGESGFCALFGRALRMQVARYKWLSIDPSRRSIDALLAALERDMASTAAGEAAMAHAELLHTFTRQLCTLIGEALTTRLLAEAVASEPGRPEAQEYD
ncbi:MAG: hypothetical protein ACLGI6_21570 [Gammaproteobacteria bacterium]